MTLIDFFLICLVKKHKKVKMVIRYNNRHITDISTKRKTEGSTRKHKEAQGTRAFLRPKGAIKDHPQGERGEHEHSCDQRELSRTTHKERNGGIYCNGHITDISKSYQTTRNGLRENGTDGFMINLVPNQRGGSC